MGCPGYTTRPHIPSEHTSATGHQGDHRDVKGHKPRRRLALNDAERGIVCKALLPWSTGEFGHRYLLGRIVLLVMPDTNPNEDDVTS